MKKITTFFKLNNYTKKEIVISSNKLKKILFCTFVYLLLPQILFFIGSFKISFSFCYSIASITLLYGIWKTIPKIELTIKIPFSAIITTELCIIFVLIFSGAGGLCGQQAGDYNRSNAILSDLIYYKWPVYYNENGSLKSLNYYMAYFIPGALIGKIFSSFIAGEIATLIWSIIGLNIGILLILIVSGVQKSKTILFFFFWSGLDCVGYIITCPSLFAGTTHLDHWATITGIPNSHIANYKSIATGLLWGIQHDIPAIIAAPFCCLFVKEKKYVLLSVLASSLLFWTPLTAIGLLPFFLFFLVKEKFMFKVFFSITDVFALCLIAVPTSLFFLSMNLGKAGGRNNIFRGIEWFLTNWPIFLLFVFLEFGFISILILRNGQLQKADKDIVIIATVSMFLYLFIDYGLGHDFSMCASRIPWIIIFLYFPQAYEISKKRYCRKLLVLYMIGSILSSSTEYARMFLGVIQHPFPASRSFFSGNTIKGCPTESQYTGSANALFFKYFCKKEKNTNISFFHVSNFTDSNWDKGVDIATKKCILFCYNASLLTELMNNVKFSAQTFDYKIENFDILHYDYDSTWIRIYVDKNATICQFPGKIFFQKK